MDEISHTSDRTEQRAAIATLKSYVAGFVLSLILTINAFVVVMSGAFEEGGQLFSIVVLALAQAIVQLLFFLHLGRGSRWNTIVFMFMLLTVAIVIVGSIWIMANLNYNMMPDEMNQHMIEEAGL